jgi:hypothetical protein
MVCLFIKRGETNMQQIGRKVYYDKATGNVYVTTSEMMGDVVDTTQAQDFQTYTALTGINPTTVDIIQLTYGQYADNFAKYPYHIDISTQEIVWDTSPQLTLDAQKNAKIALLSDLCDQSLNTFQSSALGTPHTYLIGQDDKGRDYMTLFAGEFSYITSTYYDPAKPIIWYTVESGNIIHSKDEFAQVFLDARDHVGNVKYKLADLEAQVLQAIDKPAVDAIVW